MSSKFKFMGNKKENRIMKKKLFDRKQIPRIEIRKKNSSSENFKVIHVNCRD